LRWFVSVVIVCHSAAVESSPRISTVAGTGSPGYSGDNGAAAPAQLANPFGVVRGLDGALYICEVDNHIIRRVARDGVISTVAGTGQRGYSGDGGPALQARLNEPYEVRSDKAGNMFFVEMKNHIVRRLDAKTQTLTTVAGTGAKAPTPDGARFAQAPLHGPRAIDFDRDGNLWLALREGNAVYKLDLKAGTLHHVAGTGKSGFTGNGGPARLATLSGPKGLSIGPDGNVYLADTGSHSIRMIDLKRGTLELIAGTGQRGDGPEGDPLQCRMARLHGVFIDADGRILIGDSEAHRVRAIRR
jgi:streptogramin lyase